MTVLNRGIGGQRVFKNRSGRICNTWDMEPPTELYNIMRIDDFRIVSPKISVTGFYQFDYYIHKYRRIYKGVIIIVHMVRGRKKRSPMRTMLLDGSSSIFAAKRGPFPNTRATQPRGVILGTSPKELGRKSFTFENRFRKMNEEESPEDVRTTTTVSVSGYTRSLIEQAAFLEGSCQPCNTIVREALEEYISKHKTY